MQITPEAGKEISDENSVTAPLPVNQKRKRMSKRGSNADKWSDDETLCFILVLHDDAMKHGCDGSTVNGPRWRDVIQEFWTRTDKKDQFSELRIESKYQRLRQETKAFEGLLKSCSGYGWDTETNTVTSSADIWAAHLTQRKDGGKGIAKFRYQGLKYWDLSNEIFGKSFATGNYVVYSTNPVSPPRSNEAAAAMENEATDWDDYPASTENVYRPMSVNTSSGSGKRTIGDMSMGADIGTSTRRKKKHSVAPVGSHNYLETHLRWKREMEEAKERKMEEQARAVASTPTEFDIYSEAAVITQVQDIVKRYGLPKNKVSMAMHHIEKESVCKLFVHLTEEFQVQWIEDLTPI